jgi:hypothetical protein
MARRRSGYQNTGPPLRMIRLPSYKVMGRWAMGEKPGESDTGPGWRRAQAMLPRVSVRKTPRTGDEMPAGDDERARTDDGRRPGLATLLMLVILAVSASGASLVFDAGMSGFLMVFGLMMLAAVLLDIVFRVDVFRQ